MQMPRERVSVWETARAKTRGQGMLNVFEKKQGGWCSGSGVCE